MFLFASNKNEVSFYKASIITVSFGVGSSFIVILVAFIQSCYYFIKIRWFLNKPEWKYFIDKNNLKPITFLYKWFFSTESHAGNIKGYLVRFDFNPQNFNNLDCIYFIEEKKLSNTEVKDIQKQLDNHNATFYNAGIKKQFNLKTQNAVYNLQQQIEDFATYLSINGFKPMKEEDNV
ncbi:MAG TPA: hypothetical protein PK546_02525 [Chitinophagales bacterium]|jgi:hypothetical protein|nr:hypothetical protein [Chitinophagales bacterium]